MHTCKECGFVGERDKDFRVQTHSKTGHTWVSGICRECARNRRSPNRLVPHKTAEERFWSYVDKQPEDVCWNWTGGVSSNGYGGFWHDNTTIGAHVFSVFLRDGTLPSQELLVRHVCNNKLCCNPQHLVVGTPKENSEDMIRAGTSQRGVKNTNNKLKSDDVKTIYESRESITALAHKYEVTKQCIYLIKQKKNWYYLFDDEVDF